jgi:hypothetical protein
LLRESTKPEKKSSGVSCDGTIQCFRNRRGFSEAGLEAALSIAEYIAEKERCNNPERNDAALYKNDKRVLSKDYYDPEILKFSLRLGRVRGRVSMKCDWPDKYN